MPTKTKTERAAPPQVLNVAFVWDMSGSMSYIHSATVEGTGNYISDLKKEEEKLVREFGKGTYTRFSLTAFDTVFEPWIADTPVADIDVSALLARYQPRGWTALYDAIAHTINSLGDREDERYLVVVMTDGMENSSVEFGGPNGKAKLRSLVESYERKGNWTFVYLGANVDAYAEASSIGIPTGNAAFYSASAGSAMKASASLSSLTSTRRASGQSTTVDAFADANLSQDYRDEDDR